MRYEQVVYGSFPFWDRGYAVLAHSPGCSPEWRDAFQSVCQKFGERPRGASEPFPGAMFTVRRFAGQRLWAVVGVSTPGADDRGRPDALVFHGLIVSNREFRKLGYDPFAMAPCLRTDWSPETTRLVAGECLPDRSPCEISPEASRIADLLRRGKNVAIETSSPADGLARSVWAALPSSSRKRLSVASWAFANELRFNLLAAPKLASLQLDSSYVGSTIADLVPSTPDQTSHNLTRNRGPSWRLRWKTWGLVAASLTLAILAISRVPRPVDAHRGETDSPPISQPPAQRSPREPLSVAPDPSRYRDTFEDPTESRAVERSLAAMGQRFLNVDADAAKGPTAWMQAIAAIRYEGPWLSADDLHAIRNGSSPGRSRALASDALIRHFAPDRPLPEGFVSGPLRWQLETLAWSFHLELNPRLTAAEIPSAIAESLTPDEPVRPNPLEAEYPALAEYTAFLQRLPGRP